MTLEQVQEHLRLRQGAIKAWVLSGPSVLDIVRALGLTVDENINPAHIQKLFDIPVVLVLPGMTEGVLV